MRLTLDISLLKQQHQIEIQVVFMLLKSRDQNTDRRKKIFVQHDFQTVRNDVCRDLIRMMGDLETTYGN